MKVFSDEVYRTDRLPDSHWLATATLPVLPRLGRDDETDVAIIGGGYAGLSAAYHLARDHGIAATVLEAGPLGFGASARNGGFATPGATKLGISAMIGRYGEEATRAYYRAQMEAIELVRGLLTDEAIDAEAVGHAVYEVAHHPSATDEVEAGAEAYRRHCGLDATFLTAAAFRAEGHGGTEQFGALRLNGPFALHPAKYLAGLATAALRRGARAFGESPVIGWTRAGGHHHLATPGGTLRARQVIVAANGYLADDLHPDLANRTLPALSNIIVTRPLNQIELAAESWSTDCPVYNARELLFYYRLLPDRRFLFGARGGVAGDPRENALMRVWLTRRLGEVFPAWRDVEVERFWNGLVCLTGRRTPALGRLPADPSVLYAFGCHGNGVNTMSWSGRQLARAVAAGGLAMPDVPLPMRDLPPHLLHPLARRIGLRAAYLVYGLKKRIAER